MAINPLSTCSTATFRSQVALAPRLAATRSAGQVNITWAILAPLSVVSATTESTSVAAGGSDVHQEPERFLIHGGLSRGYSLAEAIPAQVWFEEGEFVAAQPQLGVHAFGEDRVEALINLGEALVDQLELLRAAGGKLSPALARDLMWLEQLVISGA